MPFAKTSSFKQALFRGATSSQGSYPSPNGYGAFTLVANTWTYYGVEIPAVVGAHPEGVLHLELTLSGALTAASEQCYLFGGTSPTGTKTPLREVFSDVDPANLWEAADGDTTVSLAIPVRLWPYMWIGFRSTGTPTITPTEDIAIYTS